MKFVEALDIARANFPLQDYGGAFLDYNQVQELLMLLERVPKGTHINYKTRTFAADDTVFVVALDTEITKISRHFLNNEHKVKRSWRIVEGMEPKQDMACDLQVPLVAFSPGSQNTHQELKEDDFEPIPESHLGQAAKWLWQYAKLNEAALQRICSEHDDLFNSTKGQAYLQACRRGTRHEHAVFLSHVRTEEIKAIARMYGAFSGQGLQADRALINMTLLDNSYSESWRTDAQDDPYDCPTCKRVMAQPVGLTCGHIMCYRCYTERKAQGTPPGHSPKSSHNVLSYIHCHYRGAAHVKDRKPDLDKVTCPICHTPGALKDGASMPALACSNKRRLEVGHDEVQIGPSGPKAIPTPGSTATGTCCKSVEGRRVIVPAVHGPSSLK